MDVHGNGTAAALFGRYRLGGLIGRGGMGEVHRAYDTGRDRVVALKLLPPHLAGDADFTARFRRESRLAARLRDPHVVPIHDFGEVDGRLFIDMRLVEGTDLAAVLDGGRQLDPPRAVHLVCQVAAALDAAHRDGLVHRDVKPSNVLVTADDHVYLTDFGIAHSTDATALTDTGTALGTIHYMAPERFLQGRGDLRVDVYSLGCLLHEALTGQRPFHGDEVMAQMYAHVHLPPPRPSTLVPGLPPGLDDVVLRAMAKDPAQRFDSAGALGAAARTALIAGGPAARTPQTLVSTASPSADVVADGPASHDPWRRRALVAAAIAAVSAVAAVATIGTVLLGGARDTARSPATTPAAPATAAASATPTPAAVGEGVLVTTGEQAAGGTVGSVGEAVRDGGIEITVTGARYADSVDVGNKYSGYTPTPAGPGARFVVVEATVLNDTAKSISPGCLSGVWTAVVDGRGRKFDAITETNQVKGNAEACFPATQPGFSTPVTFVYKVPQTADVTRFVFEDQAQFRIPDAYSPGVALGLPGA